MSRRRPSGGYTLVELLAVLAIVAVLGSIAFPTLRISRERDQEEELRRSLREIRTAIDAYSQARRSGAIQPVDGVDSVLPYPSSLGALTRLYRDARPDQRGRLFRFLRSVPRDPFADPSIAPESQWVLRSYLQDADGRWTGMQSPGAVPDVYDVHTKSTARALDGTALADW